MKMKGHYKWTRKDKCLYAISMIPFVFMLIGTVGVLYKHNTIVPIAWILIYLLVNYFQAGCCVGCPYKGKYCPAFCGVYIGNVLSSILYKERHYNSRLFILNAMGGEITLIIFFLFPLYWLFLSNWYYILIYLGLIVAHILLFVPSQCPKCSYNKTCPGGNAYSLYFRFIKKKSI